MQLPHGQAKGTPSMALRVARPTNKHQCHLGIEQCRWSGPELPNQNSERVFAGPWLILTSTTVWEPVFHLISQFLFSLECQLLEEEDFNPALSLWITLSRSSQIVGPYCKFRKFDHKTYFLFLLFCFFSKLHQAGFIYFNGVLSLAAKWHVRIYFFIGLSMHKDSWSGLDCLWKGTWEEADTEGTPRSPSCPGSGGACAWREGLSGLELCLYFMAWCAVMLSKHIVMSEPVY